MNKARLETVSFDISPETMSALEAGTPLVVDMPFIRRRNPPLARALDGDGLRWFCSVALKSARRAIGTLTVATRADHRFDPDAVDLIVKVSGQIAMAAENAE